MSLRRAPRVVRALIAPRAARGAARRGRARRRRPCRRPDGGASRSATPGGRVPRDRARGGCASRTSQSASSPKSSLSTSRRFAGAELDATDLVVRAATIPRRADRDVVDAVAVEIAGATDHAAEQLAGLASPTSAGAPCPCALGVDEDLARERRASDLRCAGAATAISRLPSPSRSRDRRHDAAEAAARIGARPVLELLAARRREDPGGADPRAVGVRARTVRRRRGRRGRRRRDRRARATYQPKDAPSSRRRVRPQHRAVLAAQRDRRDRVSCAGAPTKRSMRPSPFWSPASARSQPRFSLVGLPRASRSRRRSSASAPRRCRACAPSTRRVRRRDDHVRQPVAGEVGHQHHPVAEQPVRQLAVPRRGSARRSRPTRRWRCRSGSVPCELEARAGGDVGVAVAVDVERLAEAEAELAVRDVAGEATGDAPAGARASEQGGARRRGRDARIEDERERAAATTSRVASPAPKCRRRRVAHRQQPTQLVLAKLHCRLVCERAEGAGAVVERHLVAARGGVRRRRTPS